ncbi:LLM class flavin-dependent oxidoreductase [Nocardioides sp.]|uniref:LLM class flavin-dependent oxidoreductase n=1 Tax=Nocardioides sp. TaxID=35761 RepID=UPI0027290BB7|nr:LLM class flavin-dependent oxidoreductase [Nocardioides sp.]MDO9457027.1 LLM class flavin-dependent oxidoreductase [Nocardioides sp.]
MAGSSDGPLPDPALVVLVGPSGSGKTTWAAARYRAEEVVSSDALRALVGSGPADLDASTDAFDLLERIVAARLARGLSTVVDTLGTDDDRRLRWLGLGRAAGLACVAVVVDTPVAEARRRNADRDRPVPAAVLVQQQRRHAAVVPTLAEEGWDAVVTVPGGGRGPEPGAGTVERHTTPAPREDRRSSQGLRVVLQLSRFPWGADPRGWLRDVALAADDAGLAGIALMDHLIQIPQVDRAWSPIPEPWVALGLLAGLDTGLDLGTLVTPVTFRPAGVTAKAAATLSALTSGRTFLGVGAGWWEREHAAYGLPFPPAHERLDALETAIETMRALWSAGTKAHAGERVTLPETTCYPRPAGPIPVVVGGTGPRTLRIAAALGDAANVPSTLPALDDHLATLRRHRPDVTVTVLDLPTVGTDRDDTWARVERLRGRSTAASYAARTHAGTPAEQRDRYGLLADRGVDTVFVALADLEGPDDLARVAPLTR